MSTNKAAFEIKDGIAVIQFDNPPVNSLGLELRQAIVDGIERANADPSIQAIVLIGSGAGFSGGADIREFGTPKASTQPHLMTVINTVEASAKPVIAAINGVCMGGGLELALGCHYRIAAAGAKPRVYVCAGTYVEDVSITQTNALSLFGGLKCGDWTFDGWTRGVLPLHLKL